MSSRCVLLSECHGEKCRVALSPCPVSLLCFVAACRYVGVWPKDITRLTQFGVAESAWVVWTVLNATNDRAPKMRRNTYVLLWTYRCFGAVNLDDEMSSFSCVCVCRSRLFLNISVVVRILTWTAVKLGATVLRGVYFNVCHWSSPSHTALLHTSSSTLTTLLCLLCSDLSLTFVG